MAFNPISTLAERAIIGQSAAAGYVVKLADLMTATPVAITTVGAGISGAVMTGISYNVSVPNGKWTCNMDFKATGYTGITTVAAPAVAGVGAYRAKHIFARIEDLASDLLRVKSITLNAGFSAEDLYQLSTADPFAIDNTQPSVTAEIEWYWVTESVNPGTNAVDFRPVLEDASDKDIEIQVIPAAVPVWDAIGNIRIVLNNMTTNRRGQSVSTGTQGTHRLNYISGGDATTYGWSVDLISA
jgi:hypothetical protein